ncbi:MAG: ABC transporter ATP-binding protein, partial [Candidatus Nezhaarchaeales archaeon]
VEYDGIKALEDVNLEITEGTVTSIIGPNGSGKTTLLRCINNILKPKMGTVLIDDIRVDSLPRMEVAKRIGYVPQISPTAPFTVFEVVLMGRRPYVTWSVSERDIKIVCSALEVVGASHLVYRYIDEVSGGERQKVMLARALAQEPQVLLLDEPTSNLDIKHQLEILSLIKKLALTKKLCVVLAMHDLSLAYRFSDIMVMLKDGKIYALGDPSQVLTPENVMKVYGVEVLILDSPVQTIIPLKVVS